MIRIITCTNSKAKNAGPKAKEDIINILKSRYNSELLTETIYEDFNINRIGKFMYLIKKFIIILKNYTNKDTIVIQYPMSNQFELLSLFPKKRTIVIIHDLQGLRLLNQNKNKKELKQLKKYLYIIAHNERMKKYLIENGISSESIYTIDMFDYLVSEKKEKDKILKEGIAFVGNLSETKTPFIHQINESKMNFNLYLYGVGITENINKKIIYRGAFEPGNLPVIINQKLGLVWDGNYDESDENFSYKNYTRYNNPHKLSCYIAAGIPVIVWEKSAVSDFVKENNIGYLINNIYDINTLEFDDYDVKKQNVEKIRQKVSNGYYTNKVFDKILKNN